MIDLSSWDDSAKYIIFDDFEWIYWPNKKAFWGAQREFTITDKYRKKFTVKNWNKPMIYICNPDEEPKLNTWFKTNCITCRLPVGFSLYE